ncbi:MAG TPA: DUF192 domain-containing protein [Candidatus Sulfotelmatobacter sp.]|nr:DUF192 domain-containing protein [Candidatus Sulfotelmatobacter sp.]
MRTPLRLASALLLLPLATAQAHLNVPYCVQIPLPSSGCAPLAVKAPRDTMKLAVVTSGKLREQGLMFVKDVPAKEGMLFVFAGGDQPLQFWMKNTITPLDMVFVKQDGTVSSIAANVPSTTPQTPDAQIPRRGGSGAYVIELASGEADRLGITPGVKLALPHLSAE